MNSIVMQSEMDELVQIRESAAKLCRQVRANGGGTAQSHDQDNWFRFDEAGWLIAAIAEERGGLSLGISGLTALLTEAGRELIDLPLGDVAAALYGLSNIVPEIFDQLIVGSPESTPVIFPAFQENEQGSVLYQEPQFQANKMSDGILLSGKKIAVPNYSVPNGILLDAELDGEPVVCLVQEISRLEMSEYHLLDGTSRYNLMLKKKHIASDKAIATGKDAVKLVELIYCTQLICAAAELVGLAQKAGEIALDHLKTRRQFGRPIGSFQALQHQAADIHVDIAMSDALVREAALTMDCHGDRRSAYAAKVHAGQTALKATKGLVQFLGAMGYTEEHEAHLYLKRTMTLMLNNGTPYHLRRIFRTCEQRCP
jgi:alkylation response protein AidB-like acyl-CoA dehydrogenase